MNLHTSVTKHSSSRACRPHHDWLGSVTCCLPAMYICMFPSGHTSLSNQLCPDTLASFLVQAALCDRFTVPTKGNQWQWYSKSPWATNHGSQGEYSGELQLHSCPVCDSALKACCWHRDKISCWTDLWSGLSHPFSSPKALVTAWYIPCSLIHCDKDLF